MLSNVKVVLDTDGILYKTRVFVGDQEVACKTIDLELTGCGFVVTLVIPDVDVVMKEKEKVDTRNDSSSI